MRLSKSQRCEKRVEIFTMRLSHCLQKWVGVVAVCLLSACASNNNGEYASTATSPSPQHTNVLLIVVDDLGFMDIQPNNPDSFYDTPNLNALAEQSVNFTQSYAANPVCSPSRLALLTGVNPANVKATDWFRHRNSKPPRAGRFKKGDSIDHMPDDLKTIPQLLPEHYTSYFIGKWHLGEDPAYWPENRGFDINIGGWAGGSPAGGYFAPYRNPKLKQGTDGEYLPERLTTEAISLLDKNRHTPFFMMLSYYTVHTPLQAPKHTIEKYQHKRKDFKTNALFADEEQVWPGNRKARKVRVVQEHATYAAMVEQMDMQIGRIMAKLAETGLDSNTLVIFTSDNGGLSTSEGRPTSNAPLRGGKGWLYEGGIRVPLIIKTPDGMTGSMDTPVIGMDIAATVVSATGQQLPVGEGLNLLSVLKSEPQHDRPLIWHYPHYSNQGGFPGTALRLGKYKLIRRLEDGGLMLFDLNQDISERNNLADNLPEITSRMVNLMGNWYGESDAEFLQPLNDSAEQPWNPDK